jgi:hypothetical protein
MSELGRPRSWFIHTKARTFMHHDVALFSASKTSPSPTSGSTPPQSASQVYAFLLFIFISFFKYRGNHLDICAHMRIETEN